MISGEDEQFQEIVEGFGFSPEAEAHDLRMTLLDMVEGRFTWLQAFNSVALDVLAREQYLRFGTPEAPIGTARAWLVPSMQSDESILHDIRELYIYSPYNAEEYRQANGAHDICFFRTVSRDGISAMVAITPTQTVPFAEGEELIIEGTEEGTRILGVRIDSDTIDAELTTRDPMREIGLLTVLQDCLATYKPTSQDGLPMREDGDSQTAA